MLTAHAEEGGTYIVTLTFVDEDGDPMVPTSITWSLLTRAGVVVNERENVEVATPAASTEIVLAGDDLAILGGLVQESRVFSLTAVYTSGTHGVLTLKDSTSFRVDDLERVS